MFTSKSWLLLSLGFTSIFMNGCDSNIPTNDPDNDTSTDDIAIMAQDEIEEAEDALGLNQANP